MRYVASQHAARSRQTLKHEKIEARTASNDMLRLLDQAIKQNQLRIPAIERSIQEIKMEWNLP